MKDSMYSNLGKSIKALRNEINKKYIDSMYLLITTKIALENQDLKKLINYKKIYMTI